MAMFVIPCLAKPGQTSQLEERIVKAERSVYVLEKTKLGIEFCDQECQTLKEKNTHARYIHTFDCEMYGVTFNTLEDLETHMHTCDKYECGKCNLTLKTVSDVKNYCNSKHRNGVDFFHFMFDRED